MQRSRCFNQLAQTFLYVHAPNVNDRLRRRIYAQFLPCLKPVPDMEDGEIATVDDGASLLRRRAHRNGLRAQVAADS